MNILKNLRLSLPLVAKNNVATKFAKTWGRGGALGLLLFAMPAHAVVTIEINEGVNAAIPIAIIPFSSVTEVPPLTEVIRNDLRRSGKFAPLDEDQFSGTPGFADVIQYSDWRLLRVDALLLGQITVRENGDYEVRFRLVDIFRERELLSQIFLEPKRNLRKVAHAISDAVYEKLVGKPGVFSTRIAYILENRNTQSQRFSLQVADWDGYNPRTILQSPEPIMSPAWSPDGSQLAYVSFEKKRPIIYLQNLWSGERRQFSSKSGVNGAPAWSPDGTQLAFTLSIDGNSEIYTADVDGGNLRRLTRNIAIDTEPAWSADGQFIVFTSSRGSQEPQLYRVSAFGGRATRLTFQGKYNAGASYSPDGKRIALVTNQDNGYQVGVYSLTEKTVRALSITRQDESPTFSSNGDMIMYATKRGGRSVLAVVSADTGFVSLLKHRGGAIREPTWSR